MTTTENFVIELAEQLCGSIREKIVWPILKKTDKALLVKTSGGELWLPLWRVTKRIYNANNVAELRTLLAQITSTSGDALVRACKAGGGSSDKSHKYSIAVIQENGKIRRRTFTLAKSQIKGSARRWMVPYWMVAKKLADGERVARSEWQGMSAINDEIDGVLAVIAQRVVDKESAAEQRRADLLAAQEDKARAAAERAEKWPVVLAFLKSKYKLSELRDAKVCFGSCWPGPGEPHGNLIKFAEQQECFAAYMLRRQSGAISNG